MSTALYWTLQLITFLCELGGLAGVGYAGFHLRDAGWLRWLAGLGGPVPMAVLWGVFGSPKATVTLPPAASVAFKVAWFAAAALALVAVRRPWWGLALLVVWLADFVVLALWDRPSG